MSNTTNPKSEQKTVVSTLNDLLSTVVNAREGFRVAANNVSDSDLKTFLNKAAQERATMVADLEDLIRASGGQPSETDTTAGKAHRGWISVRSTLSGEEDVSVLKECERGENHAISDYEEALKEASLAEDARETLGNQLREIQATAQALAERQT